MTKQPTILKLPGLIDVHVHLRDPGGTHKEDFKTGSQAGLAGGFTFIIDMPNNSTPTITKESLLAKIKRSKEIGQCEIGFHFGTNGKNTDEFKKVWDNPHVYGLKLYCNHTTGEMLLEDLDLLEKVFAAWESPKPILVHAEGVELAAAIGLAHAYGRRLHVCHISQAIEVELVRKAKATKQKITAGVCPHHLWLTGSDREKMGSFALMKPPLGTKEDQRELWKGLNDGTIDIIETDHAPHTIEEKKSDKPPYGVPGLETALGLVLKGVQEKKIPLSLVKKVMYTNPKRIFNIKAQPYTRVIVDLAKTWVVGENGYKSKCGWSPFDGWKLPGAITKMTYLGEPVVFPVPFYDANRSYEDNYEKGPFGSFVTSETDAYRAKPAYEFLGAKLSLPFGIPAGPLLNSKFVAGAFANGFDIATYKTVRSRAYECHPFPNVLAVHPTQKLTPDQKEALQADHNYTSPLSITNSFGVPSMPPKVWQKDMELAVKKASNGQVMVGSFQGTADGSGNVQKYIDDFVLTARLVKETGAKILEANLSCPNEGNANLLCFDIERTAKIAFAIKEEIGNTPLILKMAYFEDKKTLEKFVDRLGSIADGLCAINTIAATIVDQNGEQALPGKGRARSGVCGSAIQWAGIDMVERLTKLREKKNLRYTIIGVGGVMTPEDYFAYRKAGADAVLSATGAMWNPNLAKEILQKGKI